MSPKLGVSSSFQVNVSPQYYSLFNGSIDVRSSFWQNDDKKTREVASSGPILSARSAESLKHKVNDRRGWAQGSAYRKNIALSIPTLDEGLITEASDAYI